MVFCGYFDSEMVNFDLDELSTWVHSGTNITPLGSLRITLDPWHSQGCGTYEHINNFGQKCLSKRVVFTHSSIILPTSSPPKKKFSMVSRKSHDYGSPVRMGGPALIPSCDCTNALNWWIVHYYQSSLSEDLQDLDLDCMHII